MKKITSLVLSIVMLLSITAGIDLSACAETKSGYCGENVTWSLNISKKVLKISGSGEMHSFAGDSSNYHGPWFFQKDNIVDVIIADEITSIGSFAFSDCDKIENINLPNKLKEIGDSAFCGCNNLTNINLPNGIDTIYRNVFGHCKNLKNLYIPESVSYIGDCFVNGCTSLENLVVDKANQKYSAENGVLFDKNKTKIYSFSNCSKSFIPDSVTVIYNFAFAWIDNLFKIYIPISVLEIRGDAFFNCNNLTDVYYEGTESQWKSINFYYENDDLTNASIHYKHVHSYNSKTTKKATCKSTGVKTYICKDCGAKKTQTIAKLKTHTYKTYTTKATTKKNGSVVTKCTVCGAVKSKSTIYYPKTIKLSKTSYTYNGKVQTPSVTVKDSKGKTLKKNTDYTLTYAKGRKNVGKYAVKITFKGKYSGSKTLYYTIKPKATSISKLTAGKKKFTVKWKKQTAQTTGYQIQYSTNKNFKSAKTATVSKNKTTSKTISKLKAKKKYYVRIRTYKTVGKTKYYSSWSKAKAVTTKR